ncbi:MAG: prepilin-type N-terminal cleavage/methylation domain-containing protein, partial [Deltaproteobacteria bacterium]|nr:prepilin-type N-terminal cleavage/methylation domain-containing protein [Deltaproteobacteria bacterium]
MKIDKKGFTAVELLISLAIMSMTLGSIYSLYMSFIRTCTKESVKIKLQQNVRSSLDMMIRDIRLAGLDPEGTGEFGITEVTPQRIKFTADRDMDGELDTPNDDDIIDLSDLEYMEYEFDNSNGIVRMSLYKPDGTTRVMSDTLVENVTGLTFSYFTSNDVTTSNLDDIRTVGIEMTIKKISARDGPVSRTLIKR